MLRTYFEWLPITDDHLAVVAGLPFHHKDPFDRMLIAQASWEGIPVVSAGFPVRSLSCQTALVKHSRRPTAKTLRTAGMK